MNEGKNISHILNKFTKVFISKEQATGWLPKEVSLYLDSYYAL
jgi:hypothetical protein